MVSRWLLLSVLASSMFACAGQIPIVGYDIDGRMIESAIPRDRFISQMREGVNSLSESVLKTVSEEQFDQVNLSLRGIRLGLGLKGSVGIGQLYRLGGGVGFDLHFSNKY